MGADVVAPRAAIYLRQSLDRPDGIEGQRKRCLSLAVARGWSVVATFEDNEVRASAPRGRDSAWYSMLERIGRDFKIIIAVDLDRLLRSTNDLNKLIDRGAQVVTVDSEVDLTTADGEFRATMIAGIARFETRRASERQKRHQAAKALRGDWHGGHAPFGYTAANGHLRPEPSEVALIEEATHRLLELRQPAHAIITDWNNHGVRTRRGGNWRQTSLRAILLNRATLGENAAGILGWDPIVDRDTFDRLTSLFSDPSRRLTLSPVVPGQTYALGGGLCVCAYCGERLTPSRKTTAKGKRDIIGCLARVHGPSPLHPRVERQVTRNGVTVTVWQDTHRVSVDHNLLEAYLFEQALGRLGAISKDATGSERADGPAGDLANLIGRRTAAVDRHRRVEEMHTDGDLTTAEYLRLQDAHNMAIAQINNELQTLLGDTNDNKAIWPHVDPFASWQTWTTGQRRTLLKMMIERVVLHDWPSGMPRQRARLDNETGEDHEAALYTVLRSAVAARVRIDWRSACVTQPSEVKGT